MARVHTTLGAIYEKLGEYQTVFPMDQHWAVVSTHLVFDVGLMVVILHGSREAIRIPAKSEVAKSSRPGERSWVSACSPRSSEHSMSPGTDTGRSQGVTTIAAHKLATLGRDDRETESNYPLRGLEIPAIR